MDYGFADKVTILGTNYRIELKTSEEDSGLTGDHAGANGYCDIFEKKIVIHDKIREGDLKGEISEKYFQWSKKTLRHEIVHAFLAESGLHKQAKICGSWATNEEMVDWIALQGPKIVVAWAESGALYE